MFFSRATTYLTLLFSLFLATLSSCSYVIDLVDDGHHQVIGSEDESLSILFSHNINGETHPCGCRQFPLGGFAQIRGLMHEIEQKGPILYVDTGNAFFPSTTVPQHVSDSLTFTARNISSALRELNLNYFVPGAQDFAAGEHFLKDILNENKHQVLAANLKDTESIKARAWDKIETGPHRIYFIGLVSPKVLPPSQRHLFSETHQAFEKSFAEIKADGFDPEAPFHRLIVLSSSGMNHDIELAEKYAGISWIIGGHSQSFLTHPRNINGAKIVQVLGRNHYLGEVRIDLTSDKQNDSYTIHEVSEGKAALIDPNPMEEFMSSYMSELSRIQVAEQEKMGGSFSSDDHLIPTAQSCLECHQAQADKWMETPHSMAFLTLKQANEATNLNCIECHSVGLGDPHGFQRSQDLVIFEEQMEGEKEMETKKLEQMRQNYWSAVSSSFEDVGSVRALRPEELRKHSKRWMEIDQQFNVAHNFSGVQCMNCHSQPLDHPFDFGTEKQSPQQRAEMMKNNCLSCHDADQSPQWYHTDERGIATEVDNEVLQEMIKKVACPSLSYD